MRILFLHIVFFSLISSFNAQQIELLYHWKDTTLPASSAHNNTYNEVWGFTQNGREYGVIGTTMGTHFFDVTDVNNISQVDFVPGKAQGPVIIHRDFHDYNGYLYMVADEGASSLQIADLSYLPDSVSLVYDSDEHFVRSHNIFIDSASAKMYVCNIDVFIYSLSTPANPSLITSIDMPSHSHDIFVRNDTAFINAGPDGLLIYDVSTSTPSLLNSLTIYPQKGYNHSGWLSNDGSIYIFADEDHGMDMKVLDVSDINDLTVRSTFMTSTDAFSIPHNQIIKNNYVYVSQYFDGFRLYDFSDPDNVVEVGSYATSSIPVTNNKYEGAWGIYPFPNNGKVLVSDMQEGLFVLDVSDVITSSHENTEDNNLLSVFPNPAKEFTSFTNSSFNELEILDLTGKTVMSLKIEGGKNHIDLSSLSSGTYMVKAYNLNGSAYTKLIIQ